MAGYEFDQSLSLENLSSFLPGGRQKRPGEGVDDELLARLASAGSQTEEELLKLFQSRPNVYLNVMASLQGVMNNSDVNLIHAEVIRRATLAKLEEKGEAVLEQASSRVTGAIPTARASGLLMSQGAAPDSARAVVARQSVASPSQSPHAGMQSLYGSRSGHGDVGVNGGVNGEGAEEIEVVLATPAGEFTLLVNESEARPGYRPPEMPDIHIPGIEIEDLTLDISEGAFQRGRIAGKFTDATFFETFELDVTASSGGPGQRQRADVQAEFTGQVKLPGLVEPVETTFNLSGEGVRTTLAINSGLGGPLSGLQLSGELSVLAADLITCQGELAISDPSESPAFSGEVAFNVSGTWDTLSATGQIEIHGLSFLLDQDKIVLNVTYQDGAFGAELAAPLSHTSEKDGLTTVVEVRAFSYDPATAFSGEGGVSVDFAGYAKAAVESAVFKENQLESATLTFEASEFALPQENAVVRGALSGTVGFDGLNFAGAEIDARLALAVGGTEVELVSTMSVAENGVLSGQVSLAEGAAVEIGTFLTIQSFQADFDSITGVTQASGTGSFSAGDHISGELQVNYDAEGGFTVSGTAAVSDASGEVGDGAFSLRLGEGVSGDGHFALSAEYGLPDRGVGPLFLLPGTTVRLSVTENLLGPALLESGAFRYEAGEQGGVIEGTVAGSLDLETGEVNAQGEATFTEDWQLGSGDVVVTIKAGETSSLTATVVASELTEVAGSFGYSCDLPLGEQRLALSGELEGHYDAQTQLLNGRATAVLGQAVTLTAGTDTLTVLEDTEASLTVQANEIEQIGLNLHAEARLQAAALEGEALLDLRIDDGLYDQSAGISGIGRVSLPQDVVVVDREVDAKLVLKSGSQADVLVEGSRVENITGNLDFETEMPLQEQMLRLEGQLRNVDIVNGEDAFVVSGVASATVTEALSFSEGERTITILPETGVEVTVAANQLTQASFDLKATYEDVGQPFTAPLSAELTGRVDYADGLFSGQATASLTADAVMAFEAATVTLRKGGSVEATLQENRLTSLVGQLPFAAEVPLIQEQTLSLEGTLDGAYSNADGTVSVRGAIEAEMTEPVALTSENGEHAFTLLPGTKVNGEMLDGELSAAGFELNATYAYSGAPFVSPLNAAITGQVNYSQEGGISGNADAVLSADAEVVVGANATRIVLKQSSAVSAVVTANALTSLTGTLLFDADIPIIQEQVISVTGELNGSFTMEGETGRLEGSMTAEMTEDVALHSESREHSFEIFAGTKVSGAMLDGEVTQASLDLNAKYTYSGVPFTTPLAADITGQVNYAQESGISGQAQAALSGPAEMLVGANDTRIVLKEGSVVEATVAANEVQALTGTLLFDADIPLIQEQVISVTGELNGSYRKDGESASIEGSMQAEMTNDVTLYSESREHCFCLLAGTQLSGAMANGEVTQAAMELNAQYTYSGVPFTSPLVADLTGQVTYQQESGISGTAQATLSANAEMLVGANDTRVVLKTGSAVSADVTANELTSLTGTLLFDADIPFVQEQVIQVTGELNGSYTREGESASVQGSMSAALTNDVTLYSESREHCFSVLAGTGVNGAMDNGEVTEATLDLQAQYSYSGMPFTTPLAADITGQVTYRQEGGLSGTAQAVLSADAELLLGADSQVWLKQGSAVSASFEEGELTALTGTLSFEADVAVAQGQTLSVAGELTGSYTQEGGEARLEGTMQAELTQEVELSSGGHVFTVLPGTGVTGAFANGELTDAGLSLKATYVYTGAPFANGLEASVEGDVRYQEGQISGQATIALSADAVIEVGEGTRVTLKESSNLTATLEETTLVSIEGAINLEADIPFEGRELGLIGTLEGSYRAGDGAASLDGTLTAGLKEAFEVPVAGGTLTVLTDTEVRATVAESRFDNLGFTLHALYARTEKPALELDLLMADAIYSAGSGFSGTAQATVVSERAEVLSVGNYVLYIEAGSGAEVRITENAIEHIGGSLSTILVDDGTDFIRARLSADYQVAENLFSGTGTAEVLCEKELASAGELKLYVIPGSGAEIDIQANELQRISGTLHLRIDDADGAFITIALEGAFDAAGDGDFSGEGAAEIVREKELGGVGDYKFWLTEGSGAHVKINKNAIEEVGGTVNFKIMDGDPAPLIVGHAEGVYSAETQTFTGSGDARLGRDLEFDLGGSTMVKFLEGSGGNATITENKLEELGGVLKLELWRDGEALVAVEGEGTYDAVNNVIVEATGSATLLRELELPGGIAKISEVSGNATIRNNELVQAGGTARIEALIGDVVQITGTLSHFNWTNEGGEDAFEVDGSVEINLLGEFADRLSGTVEIMYRSATNELQVTGEVTFQINEWLGGKIGLTLDQDWVPTLSGTLEVTDVTLVPGRDLFKIAQSMPFSIPVFPGINVALGLEFGLGLSMLPLTFSTSISIENYRPTESAMPNFEAQLELSTGLNFFAELAPYLGVSVGVSGAEAGLRLKGTARIDAPLTLTPHGVLRGGPDGFEGELGIGVSLTPTVTLQAEPQAFAALGGQSFEHSFATWEYPLGNIFNFEWSKTYKFGDKGETEQEGSPSVTQDAPAGVSDTSTSYEEAGAVASRFSNPVAGDSLPGRPQLADPETIGANSPAAGMDEGGLGGIGDKIKEAGEWANKLGSVAQLFSTIMDLVGIAAMTGPLATMAIPLYIGYRIFIKQDLSLQGLLQSFRDLFDILAFLATKGMDLLASIIPPWVKEAWDALQSMTFEEVVRKAIDWVKEKVQGAVGATWYQVLEPFMGYLDSQGDKLIELVNTIVSGGLNLRTILQFVGRLVGFAISSITDLIAAGVSAIQTLRTIFNQCVAEGLIWCKRYRQRFLDDFEYSLEIPGICGPWTDRGKAAVRAIVWGLEKLGVPVQEA